MIRFYYKDTICKFKHKSIVDILGELALNNEFALETTQKEAWISQIEILQQALSPFDGQIYFEYNIPRIGKRVDVVLIIESIIFVVEFKVGLKDYLRGHIEQAWDYALDLKNFHEESHSASIVPILVATNAKKILSDFIAFDDNVYSPILCNQVEFSNIIKSALSFINNKGKLDEYIWDISRYMPTPTIIEAARSLYNHHSVENITRNDAGKNLTVTCKTIFERIDYAKQNNRKVICFVTGVPGAGKTLVGLNVATQTTKTDTLAVYLSGNGPLVKILCEALARDKVQQIKEKRKRDDNVKKMTLTEARSQVKTFIQNVHHFRDAYLEGTKILNGEILADNDYFRTETNKEKSFTPPDRIVIFDEAQRAWNKNMTADFMARKKGRPDFPYSEPEYLISCMDRHKDWAFIICLVGGGQEINRGEAGIEEWINAVNTKFSHWDICISNKLYDLEYAAGRAIDMIQNKEQLFLDSNLHLTTSMRSFRAENLSAFIHQLLDKNINEARELYAELDKYPLIITRSIETAKEWLKNKARGSERYGIVVSSQAYRLKPFSFDVRVKTDPVHWFLDDKDDVRSSYYMEDVATEFDVQGLELDWVCLVWDGDFRATDNGWSSHSFVGSKWNTIQKEERKAYQKNAYRVLLTRARQGMIIVVPEGNSDDLTRKPEFYDKTFNYLKAIGIKEI